MTIRKSFKILLLAGALLVLLTLAAWLAIDFVVLPRLALRLSAFLEQQTGIAVSLQKPRYRPPLSLRLGSLEIRDYGRAEKLTLTLRKIPKTQELADFAAAARRLASEDPGSLLANPARLAETLRLQPALPRRLTVGHFAIGQAEKRIEGSLGFRSGRDDLILDTDFSLPLTARLRAEHSYQTGQTGLTLSLEMEPDSRWPLSFVPDNSRLRLDLQADQVQSQAWQLSGTLAGTVGPQTGAYRFKAEFEPEAERSVPLYAKDRPTLRVPVRGELRFSYGLATAGEISFTMLPRLVGLFAAPAVHAPDDPAAGTTVTSFDAAGAAAGSAADPAAADSAADPAMANFVIASRAPGEASEKPKSPAVRPAWLELKLEVTQQALAPALTLLPPALLGRLAEASYSGRLDLKAVVEIPLYDIGSAQLAAEHQLSELRIDNLPGFERLFRLDAAFVHRVYDDFNQRLLRLEVPAFRQPDLDWLLRHSERSQRWLLEQQAAREQARRIHPGPNLTVLPAETIIPAADEATESGRKVAAEGDSAIEGINAGEEAAPGMADRPVLRYRRIDEVSPYLVAAVLTAEDGDFFFHTGIDWKNLAAAAARNLAAGSLDYGASTISMQVIKNVFLDQEKSFARKLQEALLVYLMEEQLRIPKARILELYLNIAEFGPGVYGAEQAARYYFDITAAELSLGQAAWLASILPSPKRYHSYYEAGAISPGWFIRMVSLLDVMLERGRISQEEYQLASTAAPLFAK